jgi:pimeloyl-ACP methyl ester carboxylesterase
MKKLSFVWILILFLTAFVFAQTPKDKFADFGGVKVHYNDIGKGKNALIFVHGWTCNLEFWSKSIKEFPEYRVIALDLPGHGKSDKPQTVYSMEYFAKSIEAVMKDAKVKKAVLVGHSMGTPVIRQFYSLYPKQTLGLVIVDGALRLDFPKDQMDQFMKMLRTNYKAVAPSMVDRMFLPESDKNLKKTISESMLSTPEYVALSAMEQMADEKTWTKDKIDVPVLAILAQSGGWKPDTETFYRTIAPNLDFRMWSGVSHFLMMEQPEVFNRSIKYFIAKNKLL